MATSLLQIGSSGVMAHQRQLVTTGNNISNVNSEGHSVQRTRYAAEEVGGVGRGHTERVVDQFAQAAVWRDTTTLANRQAYLDSVSAIDAILSDESLSLGGKLDGMFSSLHAMNDDPTSLTTRSLSIAQFQAIADRFYDMSEQYRVQQAAINNDMDEKVSEVNHLVSNIAQMNDQITAFNEPYESGALDTLLDERDAAIRELSELVQINVVENPKGAKLIYMNNGTSLVLERNFATLELEHNDPDNTKMDLSVVLGAGKTDITAELAGGKIGALMEYQSSDLDTSRNQLGQLALAMGDAFNRQNALGMDLNSELGGDIFALPSFEGMNYSHNSGTGAINGSIIGGEGANLTHYDYEVTFTSATDFEIQRFNGGEPVGDPEVGTVPAAPNTFEIDGLALDMSAGGAFAMNDRFILQPTRYAARTLSVSISEADKLALAAPVRVEGSLSNTSKAQIELSQVTDTDPATSSFTLPGGLDSSAPHQVQVNASGDYEIYDANNNLLGTATATAGNDCIFTSAGLSPGFDVCINGEAMPGDVFNITYNTNGYADNFNGLRFVDMQQEDLVRKGLATSGDSAMTLNEAYSSVVSYIGGKTSEARIDVDAAKALLTQSENWYNSISGVNLDEEAANLVRFQQAYAACAQVVSVAQSTFDTLLASVR